MTDQACVELLRWALPRLGLRWSGFRKVRGQVCKRLKRRLAELSLEDVASYRARLESDASEWAALDGLCRVTISRFCRDKGTFEHLAASTLPRLARSAAAAGRQVLNAWSAGCASGEEPYTLALAWSFEVAPRHPDVSLHVLGTDVDPVLIDRARRACYPSASLRDVPDRWRPALTRSEQVDDEWCLDLGATPGVRFELRDVRDPPPPGPFDLILCRNLAFTYFDLELQRRLVERLLAALRPEGAIVIGGHETLPPGPWPLEEEAPGRMVHRLVAGADPPVEASAEPQP